MGPEKIFPNSDEDGQQDGFFDSSYEVVSEWVVEEPDEESGVEPGNELENGGGYTYQPLNQDPESGTWESSHAADIESHEEQVQDIQERVQAMGLYLPEPPVDSEEEDEEELAGAAAWSNRNSIPMDPEHVELVKRTMADIKLPTISIPAWAKEMSNDQWKDIVQQAVQSRQSSAGLKPQQK